MNLTSALAPARQAGVLLALVLPWLWPFTGGPSPGVQPWLGAAACAILLWLLRRSLTLPLLAAGWLSAALISSAMGLLQYFGQTAPFSPWIHAADLGEAYANLRQRNQFATLTSMGLAAVLWWACAQGRPARTAHKAWLMAAVALLVVGNAASSSRTGLLQLLLVATLLVLWGGWNQAWPRRMLLAALLSYGVAVVVLPVLAGHDPTAHGMLARFNDTEVGCNSRWVLWSNVVTLIREHPWLGWGWGELDYAHFITLYEGQRFCEILDNAHSLPLHLAVELGVPAALLLCSAGLLLMLRMRPWRETAPARQLAWAVLGVILLHSMLEYPLWYGPFQMAVVLCGWLLLPSNQPAATTNAASKPLKTKGLEFSVALCLLTGLTYAAWDYHRVSQIFYPPDYRAAAYRDNTLQKIRASWLFKEQVRFAEYTITPLTRENAEHIHDMGQQVLHFSPEAQVVEKLMASATLLGRDEEAKFYLARFRAAYPKEHARWAAQQRQTHSQQP